MSTLTVERAAAVARTSAARRRERLFFTGMAAAVVLTVFAGFARTYYLRPYFAATPLAPLLHLHGLVFTSWVALYFAQTALIAARRTQVHRRLGVAGAVVAALVVAVGAVTAVVRAKQGATPLDGLSPLIFLTVPLGDVFVFAVLAGTGLSLRRRLDTHKRLMLLATISILPAAVARLPFDFVARGGPFVFFGLTDLFILPCLAYDLATRGRLHRATLWGGLLIVASHPLRLLVGGTDAWVTFASWLTRLVP